MSQFSRCATATSASSTVLESCATPVQPVSSSEPGRAAKLTISGMAAGSTHGAGHSQRLVHWPGHAAASLPSQSSPASTVSLPQFGAGVAVALGTAPVGVAVAPPPPDVVVGVGAGEAVGVAVGFGPVPLHAGG